MATRARGNRLYIFLPQRSRRCRETKKKNTHTCSENVPVLQYADINVRITQFTSVTLTDWCSERRTSAELLVRGGTKT